MDRNVIHLHTFLNPDGAATLHIYCSSNLSKDVRVGVVDLQSLKAELDGQVRAADRLRHHFQKVTQLRRHSQDNKSTISELFNNHEKEFHRERDQGCIAES